MRWFGYGAAEGPELCVYHTPPGTYRLQGRDTGTWFIKERFVWGFGPAAGGAGGGAGGSWDSDPGYGEQCYGGSLQGTVSLKGKSFAGLDL